MKNLIIVCLFLMHIALFFIYINISFSSNERHGLSVYFQAKILSHYEFTSNIKVKKNINGNEFVLGAKYMRDALNDPFIKPDIDSLINTTRHFFFISSSVYIFLLYFVFSLNCDAFPLESATIILPSKESDARFSYLKKV